MFAGFASLALFQGFTMYRMQKQIEKQGEQKDSARRTTTEESTAAPEEERKLTIDTKPAQSTSTSE